MPARRGEEHIALQIDPGRGAAAFGAAVAVTQMPFSRAEFLNQRLSIRKVLNGFPVFFILKRVEKIPQKGVIVMTVNRGWPHVDQQLIFQRGPFRQVKMALAGQRAVIYLM
jgi:hypothetical protein